MPGPKSNPAQAVDLILTNGKVVTLDRSGTTGSAIAISGDRIAAVGSDIDIAALAGPSTKKIDAKGRLVVPGLIDGHAHMDREGLKDRLPSLSGCRSIDDILDRIRDQVKRQLPGGWVVMMPVGEPPFYTGVPANLREGRFPTRHDLDRVSPSNPVYIRAIWGHWRNTLPLVSIANTKALELAGITRATQPPAPSITIEKDTSGELTGVFIEQTYKPLVEKTLMKCIPRFTLDDRVAGLRRSMQVYNGYGTTSVFEGHGIASEVLAAYQQLREEGPLPVRSVLMASPAWHSVSPAGVKALLGDWGRWLAKRGFGDDDLRMTGLYTESDYSDENRLRAECGPYTGWAGFNFNSALPENVMVDMMVEAARLGIRIGSFSPRILDLYEAVDKRAPIGGQRWLMEHVGIFTADEIKRVRDLGIVLQAYSKKWISQEGERHRRKLGETRSSEVLPMRAILDAGVHISLATDNVPPTLFDPIWHVVARRTEGGTTPLAPDQSISRLEALACATREGAYLSFDEDRKGTIEPGKFADIAVLDKDLLTVPESEIPSIQSALTITGGRVVHGHP